MHRYGSLMAINPSTSKYSLSPSTNTRQNAVHRGHYFFQELISWVRSSKVTECMEKRHSLHSKFSGNMHLSCWPTRSRPRIGDHYFHSWCLSIRLWVREPVSLESKIIQQRWNKIRYSATWGLVDHYIYRICYFHLSISENFNISARCTWPTRLEW